MLYVIQLTPPGRGAIATLRIEGPGAVEAVQSGFQAHSGRTLAHYAPHQIVVGHFGGEKGEEVVVRRCANDAVELHCHGGLAAVAMIRESLVAAGCVSLDWQEATPSLSLLADARTERTAAILLDQYHGAFEREIAEIRRLIDQGESMTAKQQIDALLARAELGRRLTHPFRVVLTGRPNVGKSSLMNALAGYDRAIVHHTPGTTRDLVTATTAIDGWPVELCDTAGLHTETSSPLPFGEGLGVRAALSDTPTLTLNLSQTDGGQEVERLSGISAVEQAGIQLAKERIAQADLVVLVSNQNEPWPPEDQNLLDQWPGALLVHNKCDLTKSIGTRPTGLSVSTLRGDGMESLLEAIARRLVPSPPPPGAGVPLTEEQVELLRQFCL